MVNQKFNESAPESLSDPSLPFRVYLFIDVVDEIENDHELLDFVQRTKICVSSRPWRIFEKALQSTPILRLQDFVHSDIAHFVQGQLFDKESTREIV